MTNSSDGIDSTDFDYVMTLPKIAKLEEDSEPVVFVFGWAGCQDQYLEKYSQLYENLGCITVRYTAPLSLTFFNRHKLHLIGEKIHTTLYDLDLQGHPLIFHMLSGNGCLVYNAFRRHVINIGDDNLQFAGLVFDSAPSAATYYQMAIAFTEASYSRTNDWLKIGIIATATLLFFIGDSIQLIYNYFTTHSTQALQQFRQTFQSDLRADQLFCPNLFLYSDGDQIVSEKTVEAFIDYQRDKGIDVTQIKFSKSAHVQHLKNFTKDYTSAVQNFTAKATGKQDSL